MAAIQLTFIVLSSILLLYIVFALLSKKRMPLVTELLYFFVYVISATFFFCPSTFSWLDVHFGVQLALNLVLTLSVFLLLAICVRLYQKLDSLRIEITNLTRLVAISETKVGKKK